MEQQRPKITLQVSQEDWEKTPASVRQLVESMAADIEKFDTTKM